MAQSSAPAIFCKKLVTLINTIISLKIGALKLAEFPDHISIDYSSILQQNRCSVARQFLQLCFLMAVFLWPIYLCHFVL